jgi:acetyl-CoA carboxylase alpha subunit
VNREKKIGELEKKIRDLFHENQAKQMELDNEISSLKEKVISLKEELLNTSFHTPVN